MRGLSPSPVFKVGDSSSLCLPPPPPTFPHLSIYVSSSTASPTVHSSIKRVSLSLKELCWALESFVFPTQDVKVIFCMMFAQEAESDQFLHK